MFVRFKQVLLEQTLDQARLYFEVRSADNGTKAPVCN